MTAALHLLLLAAAAVLVDSRPQEGDFTFPGEAQRPSRFPLSRPQTVITPRQNRPGSTTATTPATSDDASTTRIPPRDEGNRLISYTPAGCNCPHTNQYTPVCGTDGATYLNRGVMACYQMCGRDVDVYLVGACGRNNG